MSVQKNTYEIYDYLSVPTTAVETETDQFLIVQGDGTLFVNKQVQYVSQETSTEVQSCSMYDVTTQPVYVNVDNSAELISVPGNLVLSDRSHNLYASSFIMQELQNRETSDSQETSLPNTTKDEEGQLVIEFKTDEVKNANIVYPSTVDRDPDKQIITNCTEVTLNEDQYKMLQEKGWVLLETSDKTFVLDTMGLHDVTNNKDSVEKLKSEINNISKTSVSIQKSNDSTITQNNEIKVSQIDNSSKNSTTNEPVRYSAESDVKTEEKQISLPPLVPISKKRDVPIRQDSMKSQSVQTKKTQHNDLLQISVTESLKHRKVIKLKTTLAAKDIPDKIVLGKTVHGRKLIARVVKSESKTPSENGIAMNNYRNENKFSVLDSKVKTRLYLEAIKSSMLSTDPKIINNFDFGNLVEHMLIYPEDSNSFHLLNIVSNVKQLLTLPAFMQTVENKSLVVTKVTKQNKDNVDSVTVTPTLVPGKVVQLVNGSEFVHMPSILNSLMDDSGSPPLTHFLHVHITETKNGDTTEGVSVSMQNRPVPLKTLKTTKDKKKAFACGSCASVFLTEFLLQNHQKKCINNLLKTDLVDTSDSENTKNSYYTVKTQKGTVHVCIECKMVFNKICNIKRHVKTHSSQEQKVMDNKGLTNEKLYKCNICPSAYLHPSTLSKHIVQSHIQNK